MLIDKNENLVENSKVNIIFEEKSHQYFDADSGEEYISVTKFLSKFKSFDKDYWAEYKAKQNNTTKEEILRQWDEIALEATTKGKKYHLALENLIKKGEFDKNYEKFLNSFIDIGFKGKLISEKLVYHKKTKIAGTSDIIEYFPDEKLINIIDLKTNKKIDYQNEYKQKMIHLTHLDDCNYNVYTLQLTLYAYFCEEMGLKVGNLKLLWVNPKTELIEIIPVEYRREDVKKMFEYRF